MPIAPLPSAGPARVLPMHFDETAHRSPPLVAQRKRWTDFWKQHWSGDYSLARSYWLHYRLVQLGLLLLVAASALLSARVSLSAHSALALLAPVVVAAVTVWQIRGVWAAAQRTAKSSKFWSRAVQVTLVLELILLHLPAYRSRLVRLPDFAAAVFQHDTPRCTWGGGTRDGVVVLRGELDEDAAPQLREAIARVPNVTTVQIESDGGLFHAGAQLAAIIRSHGLDTYVEDHCSAACTLVFLAGRNRTIAPGAKLGFHQVHAIDGLRLASIDQYLTRMLYANARLHESFFERFDQEGAAYGWYPDGDYLLQQRVLTH